MGPQGDLTKNFRDQLTVRDTGNPGEGGDGHSTRYITVHRVELSTWKFGQKEILFSVPTEQPDLSKIHHLVGILNLKNIHLISVGPQKISDFDFKESLDLTRANLKNNFQFSVIAVKLHFSWCCKLGENFRLTRLIASFYFS